MEGFRQKFPYRETEARVYKWEKERDYVNIREGRNVVYAESVGEGRKRARERKRGSKTTPFLIANHCIAKSEDGEWIGGFLVFSSQLKWVGFGGVGLSIKNHSSQLPATHHNSKWNEWIKFVCFSPRFVFLHPISYLCFSQVLKITLFCLIDN